MLMCPLSFSQQVACSSKKPHCYYKSRQTCIIKWLEEGHFLENVQEQFLRDKCEVKCCSRDESVNLQGNCLECSASNLFHYSMN